MPRDTPISPLVAAAAAFDNELQHFGRLAEEAQKRALDSRKALERVAETLKQAVDAEQELGARAQTLLAALNAAREQQEAQAASIRSRAADLERRTKQFTELAGRYQALGVEVASLNQLAQDVLSRRAGDGPGAAESASFREGLGALDQTMEKAAESAQALAKDSHEADFDDLSREAHTLFQRIVSAREKVNQTRRALGPEN
jgi:hypothetical protein